MIPVRWTHRQGLTVEPLPLPSCRAAGTSLVAALGGNLHDDGPTRVERSGLPAAWAGGSRRLLALYAAARTVPSAASPPDSRIIDPPTDLA